MIQVNGNMLNLRTSWGTETLMLGTRKVQPIDPGHSRTVLSQISAGSSLRNSHHP